MTRKRSGPGRPAAKTGTDDVKEQLLRAAQELFGAAEISAVSTKRIAQQAGVNAAMISYYFGSKRGLYLAMVEQTIGGMIERLSDAKPDTAITSFIEEYAQLLVANPWWPRFMIREVLFGDPAFRAEFATQLGARMRKTLFASLQRDIHAGDLRADLNPVLTTVSLIGMLVFPVLALPMVRQILEQSGVALEPQELSTHVTRLFLEGALPR